MNDEWVFFVVGTFFQGRELFLTKSRTKLSMKPNKRLKTFSPKK